MMLIMLLWSGSIPIPSRHTIRVPLSSVVTVTVAVDIMDVPITSVTANWNGGSEFILSRSRGRRDREMFKSGMSHWCPLAEIVQVSVTLSLGHGLFILVCNWANETEKEQWVSYVSLTTQHTKSSRTILLSFLIKFCFYNQDAHTRLALQVYLGLNTLEFSAIRR